MNDLISKEEFRNSRIKVLKMKENNEGKYVAIYLQSSIRLKGNYTLLYGLEKAKEENLPVYIFFRLNSNFRDSNFRSFKFLIEGLISLKKSLKELDIPLYILDDKSGESLEIIGKSAHTLITDKGYLREAKENNEKLKNYPCAYIEVEGNLVVPIEVASDKEEYGAYTIRKKITRYIEMSREIHKETFYSTPLKEKILKLKNENSNFDETTSTEQLNEKLKSKVKILEKESDLEEFLNSREKLPSDKVEYLGGEEEADKYLKIFIKENVQVYKKYSNAPSINRRSHLSPYLHFGHISPLDILVELEKYERAVFESNISEEETLEIKESIDAFIEELVVRRELAFNFCYYNSGYDDYILAIPEWARKSLEDHESDKREYIYSREELESYNTHDEYFNLAMKEMVQCGTMNSYMRMYWAKKILEWSISPIDAFNKTLYLNNKYFLDGRDPNSYAGVAWCYGKHDRPWAEREIFGKIRYMNSNGIESKNRFFKNV